MSRLQLRVSTAFAAVGLCVPLASIPNPVLGGSDTAAAPSAVATIVDLQPFRQSTTIRLTAANGRRGSATLVNLQPAINVWFVLTVAWDGATARSYHLENPQPRTRTLTLDQQHPSGLLVRDGADRTWCEPLADPEMAALEKARTSRTALTTICDGRLLLRHAVAGHRTRLEAATEFVRAHLWGGEAVIGLGHEVMSDANLETADAQRDPAAAAAARARTQTDAPQPAAIDPGYADRVIATPGLGIVLAGIAHGRLAAGVWYPAPTPGVYVSVVSPGVVSSLPPGAGKPAPAIDGVESAALVYLIAFDLDRVSLAWARGTTHPTLGWSAHMPAHMRTSAPGPDGVDSSAPLVSTGVVSPQDVPRTIAAFTAGFKREHGAFLWGELSQRNFATHYGFIEHGVVFSRLQPGLSTILVFDNGAVDMKTWSEADSGLLPRIRFARQNGVAVVERDPATHLIAPGRLVNQWGAGNWSGSADRRLRTMRSGVAIQEHGSKRYFLYAVFSSATPAGMVRVFQAYGCHYAMLLDMNALEHTYFAFYRTTGAKRSVEYLIKGMREVDENTGGRGVTLARFIEYADNRDFFYIVRRSQERGTP